MLHALLKSKFFNKCKSDLKATKTRIELIKKRRNAVAKYLTNDIVDLLKSGFDINAYGRAEGLILEMERLKCYESIDQYCEQVLIHLSAVDKQRDCPEDCREAVSSLMFAASRFADLPELRRLRSLFAGRYGSTLDYYVGKEFSEKTKSGHPSKDAKLRLLQEIAAGSGVEWSPKALENQLFNDAMKAREVNDRKHEFQDNMKLAGDNDVPPEDKDIMIGTTEKSVMHNQPESLTDDAMDGHEDKPHKYRSIPPPYRVEPKSANAGKMSDSSEDNAMDGAPRRAKQTVKSVRTRGRKLQLAETSSSGGSESDEKEKMTFFDKGGPDQSSEDEKLGNFLRHYTRKGSDNSKEKDKDGPSRVSSLPHESSSTPTQNDKGHVRSASWQPNAGAHVHPRLPDYDDLVAKLAQMRRDQRR